MVKELSVETIDDKVKAEEQVNLKGPANYTFFMRCFGPMFNGVPCSARR